MEPVIYLNKITKEYKTLNRSEGMLGSFKDLFSRDYNTFCAVDEVSLEVMPGEIVGYLGPNGAGKSSTIKMMTGILKPNTGEIFVNGCIPYKKRTQNAQEIGVVFGQRSQLWWALPAIESFKILKNIYLIEEKDYQDMIEFYKSLIDIDIMFHKPVRQLSLGQRTLCDILAAFLHNPKIVFLDEPTIGLDISMKAKIRELIRALNQRYNTTILLTTHDISDVDALCQRVVIIDRGKKIYDDRIEQLKHYFGRNKTVRFLVKEEDHICEGEKLTIYQNLLLERLKQKMGTLEGVDIIRKNEWINVIIDENKKNISEILSVISSVNQLSELTIEAIATEEVIRKIYEGGSVE